MNDCTEIHCEVKNINKDYDRVVLSHVNTANVNITMTSSFKIEMTNVTSHPSLIPLTIHA